MCYNIIRFYFSYSCLLYESFDYIITERKDTMKKEIFVGAAELDAVQFYYKHSHICG